jgi:hypothetical protein
MVASSAPAQDVGGPHREDEPGRGDGDEASVQDAFQSGVEQASSDRWLASALAELTETEAQVLRIAGALLDRLADSTLPPNST